MVDFLVIGHYLSVGNINMFSLVKNGKICFGYNRRGMYFDEGHKHFTGPVIDGRALYKRLLIKRK